MLDLHHQINNSQNFTDGTTAWFTFCTVRNEFCSFCSSSTWSSGPPLHKHHRLHNVGGDQVNPVCLVDDEKCSWDELL